MGDPSRYNRARQNETPDGTMGPQYAACNRGKRSLCIDLSTESGMSAMHALLAQADVFLTNYREPALKNLGLDYDTLHAAYPSLVYASVNGFGPKGPDAGKAMLDGVAAAREALSITPAMLIVKPASPAASLWILPEPCSWLWAS